MHLIICSVGIATRLRAERLEFDSRQGLGIFLFATACRPALGPTQSPIQWVPGTLSPSVKRPVREADHLPPSSTEVKNAWRYTSTPSYVFMTWCLVQYRMRLHIVDNFTLRYLTSPHLCAYSLQVSILYLFQEGMFCWVVPSCQQLVANRTLCCVLCKHRSHSLQYITPSSLIKKFVLKSGSTERL
jgi:hypothetical protein